VELAPGPIGDHGGVFVARGDDHLRGAKRARRRRLELPAAVPLDALDGDPRTHLELVLRGVLFEVAHDLIARREQWGSAPVARVGKPRGPAARVQAQPVVAPVPRGADTVALEDQRLYAEVCE